MCSSIQGKASGKGWLHDSRWSVACSDDCVSLPHALWHHNIPKLKPSPSTMHTAVSVEAVQVCSHCCYHALAPGWGNGGQSCSECLVCTGLCMEPGRAHPVRVPGRAERWEPAGQDQPGPRARPHRAAPEEPLQRLWCATHPLVCWSVIRQVGACHKNFLTIPGKQHFLLLAALHLPVDMQA